METLTTLTTARICDLIAAAEGFRAISNGTEDICWERGISFPGLNYYRLNDLETF